MEQTAGPVFQSGPLTWLASGRRVQYQLGGSKALRISTILPDSEMSGEGIERVGGVKSGYTILAGAAMVPDPSRTGVRTSTGPSEEGTTYWLGGPAAPANRVPPTDCLEILRRQFESSGLPVQVVELLLGGTRSATSAAY